jgi:hypothetical protein
LKVRSSKATQLAFTDNSVGRSLRARSSVPEYNINALSGVAVEDPNEGLSLRSRRRWPDWAERWHEHRLRPRQGQPRYLEAHPANDWLLWGNNDVQEADIGVLDEVVDGHVLKSIEADYDSEEYDVEKITGERKGPRGHKFLVQWVGWDELDWIPVRNCFCPDLIEDFRAVQRVNLLTAQVDGLESDAESLQQLTDAARTAAERGNGPNPSRKRRRDKKGRTTRRRGGDDEINNEPAAINLGDPQVIPESDDDDIWPRQRIRRSNTAIRSKSRAPSVFWHTPQEPRDGEVLWVRSITVIPGPPGSLADESPSSKMEPMVDEDQEEAWQVKDEDYDDDDEMVWEEDMNAWNSSLAAVEEAEMERRRREDAEEEERQMRMEPASQMPSVTQLTSVEPSEEKEREKRERLKNTIRKGSHQAEREKKMDQLLETVRKGSQQRREEESPRAEQEEESRRAKLEQTEKRDRERRERNRAKNQRRKAAKRRRRLSQQDEANQKRKRRSRSHKRVTQNRLAEASAAAQEKARRKESLSIHKSKNRKDRSASSMRRSEKGDTLRMARERERNATAPTVVRPEFARSMNSKQVEALISRAKQERSPELLRPFGFLPSRNTPMPSIEK